MSADEQLLLPLYISAILHFQLHRSPSAKRSISAMWLFYLLLLIVALQYQMKSSDAKCSFSAIFNFGDSNSDTGGFYAAFPAQGVPFGITYFKKPVGRATDGRLIIDFIAQGIGIPYLSPYLQSYGSDFRHGANFATLASTVLLPNTSLFVTGISPFSLAIQLNQMKNLKSRATALQNSKVYAGSKLPSPNTFGKSLYTIDIGQNDFTSNLASLGVVAVKQYLPQVVAQIVWTIKDLYENGGRTFMVFNLRPVGCYPAFVVELPHDKSDLDEYACMVSYNNAVMDYNKLLRDGVRQMQDQLQDATVVYVDIHTVMLELFRHPKDHGLLYGTKACCGFGGGTYNFDPHVYCGNSRTINGGTVSASACSDPENYVSWDGIHATDAANKLIAWAVLNGSYSDPKFPLFKLCDLDPIG